MKKQPKNIHIGNQGEHIITNLLSPYCIIRNVTQGTDTGIDLYCEIINNETSELSLHFFCQVKTRKGNKSNITNDINNHLNYWATQPVPVFVFLVEYTDQSNIIKDNVIWVYDIPFILSKNDAKTLEMIEPQRHVTEKFQICKENNNNDKLSIDNFLYHHIPWSYGLWSLRKGIVLPNPEIKKDTPEFLVGGFTYLYEDKIKECMNNSNKLLEKDLFNRQNNNL